MESHNAIDLEVDRGMLESVFDDPVIRYILLHMFLVRMHVYQNMDDDDIVEGFERLYRIGDPSVKELQESLPKDVIEELFAYHLVKNIENYSIFWNPLVWCTISILAALKNAIAFLSVR